MGILGKKDNAGTNAPNQQWIPQQNNAPQGGPWQSAPMQQGSEPQWNQNPQISGNGFQLQTKICKKCKQQIPSNAIVCPFCGAKQNSKKGIIIGIVAGLAVLGIIGSSRASGTKQDTTAEEPAVETEAVAEEQQAEEPVEESPVPQETQELEETEAVQEWSLEDYETGITYDQLARNPEQYEGAPVKFSGEVVQLIEGFFDTVEIRLAVDGNYDTILYGEYDSSIVSSRVLEGDEITIYGQSKGLMSYTSTFGGKITIPDVEIHMIDALSEAEPQYEANTVKLDFVEDYDGTYRYEAIVEIYNTGEENIYATGITFDLEDAEGSLLASDDLISVCPDVILPGEVGYLYNQYGTSMEGITDLEGVQFNPQFTIKATRKTPHEYEVTDLSIKDDTYGVTTVGRLTNNTEEAIDYLYVNVVYYDTAGAVIGITGTSLTEIAPGGTASFEISGIELPEGTTSADIAEYWVVARETTYLS